MKAADLLLQEVAPKALAYLDPDFFAGQVQGAELQTEFICVVCTGVVLDPVECKECSSLYCKHCLTSMEMACPKKMRRRRVY